MQARTATALTVRVITSILDVRPGMRVEEARKKLGKFADPKTPPVQEGGDKTEKERDKDDDDDEPKAKAHESSGPADKKIGRKEDAERARDKKAASPDTLTQKKSLRGDDDDNEGTRILWKLAPGTPYEWVFIIADPTEKITAVFGYPWKGKPIAFDEIGDVSKAPIHSPEEVAWDSLRPPLHYRITANGVKEHATDVSISFAAVRTNGIHKAGEQ